jgi:D-amino peptidase
MGKRKSRSLRIYLMTDMEGVAGILDFESWCHPGARYYDLGKEFLTGEVNAAVDGFFAGGATAVLVADGHGCGAISPKHLDPRAELMRGWPTGYPLGLDESRYDALAWVGQHAKAGTEKAHLAHTQGFGYLDLSVNGISIGEFGQVVLCGGQLGVPAIFAAGDLAFTREAADLVPGIETVAVKRGTRVGTGDELDEEAYARRNLAAIHLQPEKARAEVREGALRALRRFRRKPFGLVCLKPPYKRVAIFRSRGGGPKTISRESHPNDLCALMNMPFRPKPIGRGRLAAFFA